MRSPDGSRCAPPMAVEAEEKRLDHTNLFRLRALLALGDLELDARAVVERLVPIHVDGGEVDEDVLPTVDRDEAVALLAVEPLDSALCHCALPHSGRTRGRGRDPAT